MDDVINRCKTTWFTAACNGRNQTLANNWGLNVTWKSKIPISCSWVLPPGQMYALYCDGSLTQDRADYGGIIREKSGQLILAYAGKGMTKSVLCMDLIATSKGVRLCKDLDILHISIRSDSKLTVDIINGIVEGPWEIQTLKSKILHLLMEFERKEIIHVWREVNSPADFVATYDTGEDGITLWLEDFPQDLQSLVDMDARHTVYFRK
ncbi:uncharacterized protein LOC122084853 [Macadamia integrifolia]|uniref:uncharacterized protein LOC122084853 n=1 Tax=Macadamia integrifolia TaxID=60698 RepID=UPI001C4F5A4F|nr:uncharacterized protein LOC122084853 [Macadamia integrifolia]